MNVTWRDILAGALSAAAARGISVTPTLYESLEISAKGVADTLSSAVPSPGAPVQMVYPYQGGTGLDTSAAPVGSILYASATGTWTLLLPGANGEVLTLTAGVPSWAPGGGGGGGGGMGWSW